MPLQVSHVITRLGAEVGGAGKVEIVRGGMITPRAC